MVDFGSGVDRKYFTECLAQKDCENPKPSMYPPSPVSTVVVNKFATDNPEAYSYIQKRSFTNAQMNGLLAWAEDEQADGAIGAEYFMKNHKDIWSKWVSSDVAAKLQKAVDNL